MYSTAVTADPLCDAVEALQRYLSRHAEETEALRSLRSQLLDDSRILERTNMRGHITTSALVLDRNLRQALLIHHRAFDVWLQPGGHYEAPGSLWSSACREVSEETGLATLRLYPVSELPTPLDVDTHPIPERPTKGEAEHWHHDFAYLALAEECFVPRPQVDEVHAVRWVPLDELARFQNVRTRRLAAKALRFIEQHTRTH